MGKIRLVFICLLAFISNIEINAQTLQNATLIEGNFFYAKLYEFEIDSFKISINDKGDIKGLPKDMKLQYENGFHTRVIHFLKSGNYLLICAEVTDDDVAYNELLCLDMSSCKKKWNTQLRNFNLSVGEVENNFLYIGTIESVYKLSFDTGVKVWQKDGFYTKYEINSFESLKLTGETLELIGKNQQGDKTTFVLNKASSKIVK